jgi:hypothetical protein
MSQKPFSIGRAIRSLLQRDALMSPEVEFDFAIRRKIETSETLRTLGACSTPHSCFIPVQFGRRDVSVGSAPGLVDQAFLSGSDLLAWSSVRQAGAIFLSDMSADLHMGLTSTKATATWLGETGATPEDATLSFQGLDLKPKRISALVTASSMLLSAGGEAAEALIVGELTRALSSGVDHAVFYGAGGTDEPVGILLDPNTHKVAGAADWWAGVVSAEELCGLSDVSELAAASITSPTMRKTFRNTLITGTQNLIWDKLVNPISTNSVNSAAIFYGLWSNLTVCTWAIELIVDSFSLAHTGQVRFAANLYANHAFRTSRAFAVVS